MSIAEKRSHSHAVDYAAEDGEMSATTSICVALVVALILYVLGSAVLPAGRRRRSSTASRLRRNVVPRSLNFPRGASPTLRRLPVEQEECRDSFERPLGFRDGFLPARPGAPALPTLKTAALLAALLAYAIGFAILYPLAQASVSKSAAEGNDPALMDFVGP